MEQACLAGVVQEALFLCSVIDRVDLKPDKIHPGLASGNPAAPAPQVCVQHPAPRRGVVLKNPVIQRYRLLRRMDSLLVQLFVSLHDMPLGNALALQHLETVLAEKLETIITRTTTNTRMRDFYDIYILDQLHGNTLNRQTLHDALRATAHKRGTEQHLAEAAEVFEEVENSPVMQKLWESYRKKFSYAADLEWNIIMGAVRSLYALSEKESSL